MKFLSKILLGVFIPVSIFASVQSKSLSDFRWHHRILLLPSVTASQSTQKPIDWHHYAAQLNDREMLVFRQHKNKPSTYDQIFPQTKQAVTVTVDQKLTKKIANSIALIGKDGHLKYTFPAQQKEDDAMLENVFKIVDKMPMRQMGSGR
ncbi:MAG: DUF4174 domain-containing protein [Pseudomonadota bacterium]